MDVASRNDVVRAVARDVTLLLAHVALGVAGGVRALRGDVALLAAVEAAALARLLVAVAVVALLAPPPCRFSLAFHPLVSVRIGCFLVESIKTG